MVEIINLGNWLDSHSDCIDECDRVTDHGHVMKSYFLFRFLLSFLRYS